MESLNWVGFSGLMGKRLENGYRMVFLLGFFALFGERNRKMVAFGYRMGVGIVLSRVFFVAQGVMVYKSGCTPLSYN